MRLMSVLIMNILGPSNEVEISILCSLQYSKISSVTIARLVQITFVKPFPNSLQFVQPFQLHILYCQKLIMLHRLETPLLHEEFGDLNIISIPLSMFEIDISYISLF
jgi:hypothetical protein